MDRLCRLTKQEYDDERERLLRGREQRKAQIVHRLLSGEEVDVTALDYDIDRVHLAAIAWGPDREGFRRSHQQAGYAHRIGSR